MIHPAKYRDLINRLRGYYPVGPLDDKGSPEFGWRTFPVAPINTEAADELEQLIVMLQSVKTVLDSIDSEVAQKMAMDIEDFFGDIYQNDKRKKTD